MKTVLDWLNEAQHQGYDWVDAAIENYDAKYATLHPEPDSLTQALKFAFKWGRSSEGYNFWDEISSGICENHKHPESSIEELINKLNYLKKDLTNPILFREIREPHRSKVLITLRESCKNEIEEVKKKIANKLGIETREIVGWISADADGNIFYFRKPTKFGVQWQGIRLISKDDAIYLCGRVPEWNDEEPTPIYK